MSKNRSVIEKELRPLFSMPAWLMSVGCHMLAFLAFAFLADSVARDTAEVADRPVAIVLANHGSGEIDYMGETAATPAEAAEETESTNRRDSPLPSAEVLSEIAIGALALPEAIDGTSMAAEGIVQTADLSALGRADIPRGVDMSALRGEQDALRRAKGDLGPMARIQLFGGAPAAGRTFVFLIDRSKSMGSQGLGALSAAEGQLVRALQSLKPTHKFQIVAYHHHCVYLQVRELLPATAENKQLVVGFLGGLAALGATEHEGALLSALHLEPDVIYLLTDGGDPALTDAQQRRITKFATPKTSIHCVHFGFGPLQEPDHFLRRLAARNQGGYRYVDMSANGR
ncbi:MAG: hypothetical protein ACC628_11795 [Pirellulaceae bacterium]